MVLFSPGRVLTRVVWCCRDKPPISISPQESRPFRNHAFGLPPGDHLLDRNHYDLEESKQCSEASYLEKEEELQ